MLLEEKQVLEHTASVQLNLESKIKNLEGKFIYNNIKLNILYIIGASTGAFYYLKKSFQSKNDPS